LFLSERRQRISARMIQETVKKWRRFYRARHKRHEYASRLGERGVPLAQVRDLLGYASIRTTERYDNQRM
jgi:site-specific recombinase XerD